MNILLLCGSFRKNSYNQSLLNAAKSYLTEHTCIEHAIENLPFYNTELDGNNRTADIQAFIDKVSRADAVIIVSPEFNHSIPAVLKNAIDWASRPAFNSPFKHKPVTVLSATPSDHGGVLFQDHMKDVLDSMLCAIYPSVSYCLGNVDKKIMNGKLIDEQAQHRLERHMTGFCQWASALISAKNR